MAKYKVVKIDWENANNITPIVCLSLTDRRQIEIDIRQPVKVKKDKKESIAIVQPQFKEHVGKKLICTLNKKLAGLLGAELGDKVEITKELTESEYEAFKRENIPDPRQIMAAIMGRVSRG